MTIDWNRPIIAEHSGARVWVWGTMIGPRGGDHGKIILVQDSRGRRLPFYPCGTPIGHFAYIVNDESHTFVVRTRLARLIRLRAADLMEDQEIAEIIALEDVEGWGTF